MQEKYLRVLPFSNIPAFHPIIFFEDARGNSYLTKAGTGADFSVTRATTDASHGSNYLAIVTKTTAPAIGDLASVLFNRWVPPTRLARLQLCFKGSPSTSTPIMTFRIRWYDGTNSYDAEIIARYATGALSYINSAGVETTIAGFSFRNFSTIWNHLDFSVNFLTQRWGRVALNHQVADLSAQSTYAAAPGLAPFLQLFFSVETEANAKATLGLDQILLTPESL